MWYLKRVEQFFLIALICSLPIQVLAADDTQVYTGEYLIQQESSLRAFGNQARPQLVKKGFSLRSTGSHLSELNEDRVANDCAELALDLGPLALCEPNVKWEISAVPNDPRYDDLYGMKRIDAPGAWSDRTGSNSVVVAVLDTGVDYTHEDLKDNLWVNIGEIPDNGLDDDNNGWIDDRYGIDSYNEDGNPMDDHGHGTHCAGTIGATGNNGKGVVGVNWNVRIMALKFLSAGGGGSTLDAVSAIDYAIDNGAQVINASFGGRFSSQALFSAVQRAEQAGVLFVAAAGNENNNNDLEARYPANFALSNVVSVAATDNSDKRAFFSNYGASTVHIGAPGLSILSTLPGNRYGSLSGTSMAAPHVSGVAGLILAKFPQYSAEQVKNLMMNTVDQVASLNGLVQSGGRVNVRKALGADPSSTQPGSPTSPEPATGEGEIDDSIRVTLNGTSGRKLRGGNFRSRVIGGSAGAQGSLVLTLTNAFDTVSCDLGAITLGSTYKLRGNIPRKLGVKTASMSVNDASSPARRVTNRRGRSTKRAKQLRSLSSACSRVTARVRQLSK